MTADLHLSGPTVTVFGERDAFDSALNDELDRRGCSTHSVTTPMGWLSTTTQAVIRIDTPAGARAIQDLVERDVPATHVVVVGVVPDDDATTARLDELCRQCGERHDVSVIWHRPFVSPFDASDPSLLPADLAATVADAIGHQQAWTSAPSFVSQTYEPGRHRAHG